MSENISSRKKKCPTIRLHEIELGIYAVPGLFMWYLQNITIDQHNAIPISRMIFITVTLHIHSRDKSYHLKLSVRSTSPSFNTFSRIACKCYILAFSHSIIPPSPSLAHHTYKFQFFDFRYSNFLLADRSYYTANNITHLIRMLIHNS